MTFCPTCAQRRRMAAPSAPLPLFHGRRHRGGAVQAAPHAGGATMADHPELAALRLRSGAEHLHRLGSRAIAEFLTETGAAHGCTPLILDRLAAYESLSPAMIRAAGGEGFPPVLQEVPR